MIALYIRTDKPESEIGFVDNTSVIAEIKWHAHRQLAETLHHKIDELLGSKKLLLSDLSGVVVYRGPGSFTGLRIGISVANALAGSLNIPIVGSTGEDWIETGSRGLETGKNAVQVTPEYGGEVFITPPKK